ncbi:nickel ABC transporter substrate-binding protein [Geminicoccus harenae]|uniref:nickel ABC transporter substrate-binding protein n=1 Tax=Geminicoccus harenae TaxID=2498453 RepID=UPI00168A656F|nr:nickel ABC transporter substrate-binding protein [Geminicoccus harenae]
MLRRELLLAGAALATLPSLAARAVPQDVLVYSYPRNVGPLHPHGYAPNQMFAQAMVYEPLVRYVEGGRIEPWLATGWAVSDDGRTWDFTLRQGVTFTDGTPFDAQAVKANLDALVADKAQHGWLELIAQIQAVEVTAPDRVRLRLNDPYYPVLFELALIRPVRFLSPAVLARGEAGFAPVGTGPWRLVETAPGEHDRFVRNETYWGSRPAFAELLVKVVPDPNTRALALETGEIDLVFGSDQLSAMAFQRFAADPRFACAVSPPLASRNLALNSGRSPTDDLKVRRAILHGVNRQSLVKNVLLDLEEPAETLFARNFPYTDVPLEPFAFDRALAQALLEEAGWHRPEERAMRARDGQPLELDLCFVGSDAVQKALAEAVQAELRAIGMQARLVGLDESGMTARQQSGEFGMIFGDTWGAPYDPHSFMSGMRVPTHADFQAQSGLPMKAEIDRRIGEVLVETDEAARRDTYAWLLTILHEQAVYLPISYTTSSYVAGPRLKEVGFGPTVNEIPFESFRPSSAAL